VTTTVDGLRTDGRVVKWIGVVVHTTGPLGPNAPMSYNHWSIYLRYKNDEGSLRLNMRADWDDEAEAWDTTGILEYSTHTYTMTNSRIGNWDYAVPDISVGRI